MKSKVFKSAKNTNCPTEASNNDGEYYEEFNINDALEGKATKRKSKAKSRENTTFDNVNFNPFGPNAQRKKGKAGLDNKRESISKLAKSSIDIKDDEEMMGNNEIDYDINENNMENNEDEYKRKMEFYRKMLKNGENEGNFDNDNYDVENIEDNEEGNNMCKN